MAARYAFRPVDRDDLPLLRRWRSYPHVIQWWGPPDVEDPEELLGCADVAMWMVERGGAPFAYAQDYDPHAWPGHPFAHLPAGSRGIDQYIGDPDMLDRGHGSAFVAAHCARLFAAGAAAIGTDPHPDNLRAIRSYQKAGFTIMTDPIDTLWGRAVLMERWREAG